MKTATQRIEELLLKRNARYKFKELKASAKCTSDELEKAIAELREKYKNIVYAKFDRTFYIGDTPTWYSNQTDLSTKMPKEGVFGLISDTHLGSVAERLDILKLAYDTYEAAGVKHVFHAGDLTDGWDEYRGHINFVKVYGNQPQAIRAMKFYPKKDGLTTYFIGGNHDDESNRRKSDRGSLITHGFHHEGREYEGRKDMVYVGQYSHTFVLPEQVTLHMLHPRGNMPYAMSYKQQKRSEAMDRNLRPDIQVSGHFHTFSYVWLNNTHFIACPGVQDETEYFKRLGLPRSVGFLLVWYKIEKGRLVYLRPELHMFA